MGLRNAKDFDLIMEVLPCDKLKGIHNAVLKKLKKLESHFFI